MMNGRFSVALVLAIALILVSGVAQATTVGFVGAAGVNADLPTDYASNAASDSTGWTTSDGTGATPDVTLYWGGTPDSTGWDWEFHSAGTFAVVEGLHNGGAWDALNPPSSNAVAQLQSQATAPHAVKFSVPANVQFVLNSFDIGNASDQSNVDPNVEGPYGFDLALTRDSDSTQVWSDSTPLFEGNDGVSVDVNYTGDPGESYTLSFTRIGGGSGVTYRSGLDNLSFSQVVVPEPASLALVALCGLGLLGRRQLR